MLLRNQVEWALHCCAVMVGMPAERFLATKVLAEFHEVPKEYLSKALQSLSQAGIIEGTLGPNGGYRLAKAPSEITFLDVVEAVEGRTSSFACTEIRRNNPCRPTRMRDPKPCAVARVMWEADAAWRKTLRGVRLSDLAKTLESDIPAELAAKNTEWLLARS